MESEIKHMDQFSVAVIGGGAAGFFAAIHAKMNFPQANVYLFEKTNKVLSKVKISGGGRCNVTNGCNSVSELISGYPRGGKKLKPLFYAFNNQDTQQWFKERGVDLKTEHDGRVFPISNSSQSIIDCLMNEVNNLGVKLKTSSEVTTISPLADGRIELKIQLNQVKIFEKVIICSGGSPKLKGLSWLSALGHKLSEPIPSLFTFNVPQNNISSLMGLSVSNAIVSVQKSKLSQQCPLLITHWGFSGPAVLKLSSFGARELFKRNYQFNITINWIGIKNTEEVKRNILEAIQLNPKRKIGKLKPFDLPNRLWHLLLENSSLSLEKPAHEIGPKQLNKLIEKLTNDIYSVSGKTTFKEEFVTCGGISLSNINLNTMESKVVKNLYFAGEVVDIDGITGGYNFQAAWTTGFIAAQLG